MDEKMILSHITGLQHIGIPTKSIDSSVGFYKKLGFKVCFKSDIAVFLELNSLLIELYSSENVMEKTGAIDHIALNSDNIQLSFEYCKSTGFNILDKEINYLPFFENGVKFFTIEGINGEKIEFNQIL
ncbi:VOC family protein [Tepidanaerobacter acetatoxydans]|uniref:VOC family protein n=1 Tax=Tepidanaerobacter acetatoxydans TaxID=499229 RepID=UPI00235B6E67|nr:VOC family protein [Tepidanaerobacter acetatoxydans]